MRGKEDILLVREGERDTQPEVGRKTDKLKRRRRRKGLK